MIIVCIILSALYIVDILCDGALFQAMGYSYTSAWYTHITYMFAHANLIHLAANCYSLYMLNRFAKSIYVNTFFCCYPLVVALMFLVGVFASFGTEQLLPTVGVSGVLFAYSGFITAFLRNKTSLYFIGSAVLCILLGLFVNVNGELHFRSFVYGCIIGFIYAIICQGNHRREQEA